MQIQIDDKVIQEVISEEAQRIASSHVFAFFNYGNGNERVADVIRQRLNVFMENDLAALVDAEIERQIKNRLSELIERRLTLRVNRLATERAEAMFQQLEMGIEP